jgi:competence protein ComEC
VVVASERLRVGGTTRPVHGLVRLHLLPVPELRYGQRVEVRGRLELPREGAPFSFRAYLQRHSIYVVMERPRVKVISSGGSGGLRGRLLGLNETLRQTIIQLLPEPHAALLAGMLLGTQAAIPSEVMADFRATGTSHLLVISGWNITVLAGGVVGLLMAVGLSRRHAMALSLPVLVLYVIFVGASPSVLRAGIMGGLAIWAGLADREADAWTSLLLACTLLALLDPNVLWDAGFQLSALATAGIIGWQKPLQEWLMSHLPGNRPWLAGLVESLAVTLAALSLTLPLLVYSFGTLALIALVANLLLAPAVPPAMFFGVLGAVAGVLFLPLGQLLALLAWPFTTWLLVGTHLLAGLPAAALSVAPFSGWWLAVWYGGLLVLVAWRLRPRKDVHP